MDGGLSTSEAITISVGNVNRPPILSEIGNRNVSEGQPLEFFVTAVDPDGDPVTFSASDLPTGSTFDPATQRFTWLPGFDKAGTYKVLFSVTDSGSPKLGDEEEILIAVGNVNRPPALDPIGNKNANEGQPLSFAATGSDPDNNRLTFEASNLPAGATFDTGSHTFAWTPSYQQAGNYTNVRFTVTDEGGLTSSEVITITVGNVNRPPVLNPVGGKTVLEGQNLQFSVTASDPDGDTLSFEVENLPLGASFNGQTFSWTPSYEQAGNYKVEFSVLDNGSPLEAATEEVAISVGNVDRAPLFDPVGPQQGKEGELLQFYVHANDADGDEIAYAVTNLPAGATFDSAARLFSWTPGYRLAATYALTFAASDGTLVGETLVVITVNQPSPSELSQRLVRQVLDLHLAKSVENSLACSRELALHRAFR